MSKANTKLSVHVVLTRKQYEALQAESKATGNALSVLIRDAVQTRIEKSK